MIIIRNGKPMKIKVGDEFLVVRSHKLESWGYYAIKGYGFRIKKINNGGGVKEILRD